MSGDQVESLSAEVEAFIPRREIHMLVVRLEATRWRREYEEGLEVEIGAITFRVLEVLHGAAPETISVRARRIADVLTRLRNPIDPWNRLPLKTGDIMIVACAPRTGPGEIWDALAALQITSPFGEEVAAVRKAYTIEEFTGSAQHKSRMLAEALESNEDVLLHYAMNQLAGKRRKERETSVRLLGDAIASPRTTEDHKLELGLFVTSSAFLVRECEANHGNQMVIGRLASALLKETDPGRRATWSRILAAAVLMEYCEDPSDDKRVRSELIRSPECPPAEEVISILSEVAAGTESGEKEIVMRLLNAWQSA